MKVLLLSVTAGYGHHATAKALEDQFRSRGVTVQTVDVYDYLNKLLHDTISAGAVLQIYAPFISGVLYFGGK